MARTRPPQRAVIIGGRFAGLAVVHWLRRAGRGQPLTITLVEPHPTAAVRPGLVAALQAGRPSLRRLAIPLAPWCRRLGISWIQDVAVWIDAAASRITLAAHPPLSYDVCFVATGADAAWELIPGLGPESGGLCEPPLAQATARRLAEWTGGRWVFAVGPALGDPTVTPHLYASIDSAAYEAAFLADDSLRRRGLRRRSEIWVISPAPTVGEWLGTNTRRLLLQALADRDIRVALGARFVRVERQAVELSVGRLPADAMTWLPPYAGSRLVRASSLDDGWGWLPGDGWGRHPRYPNLYGVGDVRREALPRLGHLAMRHARSAVLHWLADRHGQTPPPPAPPVVLHVLDMGGGQGLFTYQNTLFGGSTDIAFISRLAAPAKSAFLQAYRLGGGGLPIMP